MEWRVAPGEKVEAGDVFCAIETDKMVVDFEIQDDCIVADILAEEGTLLPVGPPRSPLLVAVETEEELMAYQVRTTYMIACWLAGLLHTNVPTPMCTRLAPTSLVRSLKYVHSKAAGCFISALPRSCEEIARLCRVL